MGLHGEETVDDGCIDRDDAGALGVIASGCEGADSGIVHARARGCFGGFVPGRVAWRRAAQDGLDARRGGGWSGTVADAGDPWSRVVEQTSAGEGKDGSGRV